MAGGTGNGGTGKDGPSRGVGARRGGGRILPWIRGRPRGTCAQHAALEVPEQARAPSSGHGVKTTSAFPSGPIPDGNAEGTGVR